MMLVAIAGDDVMGDPCVFSLLIKFCLRLFQLGGFSVLFTFRIAWLMKASLGACSGLFIVLQSLRVTLCRIYETAMDELTPIFDVFLTLVSVFCSISTSLAKVMCGSWPSLASRTILR